MCPPKVTAVVRWTDAEDGHQPIAGRWPNLRSQSSKGGLEDLGDVISEKEKAGKMCSVIVAVGWGGGNSFCLEDKAGGKG